MPPEDDTKPGAANHKENTQPGAAGGGGDGTKKDPPAEGGDDLAKKTPEELAEMVRAGRKEAAGYRTKAKDLETKVNESNAKLKGIKTSLGLADDQVSPEDKIKALTAQSETQAFETAVLTTAVKHGIGEESLDYYTYLIQREAAKLAEGEELAPERIAELAKEAKAKAVPPKANTTVNEGGEDGKKTPAPGGHGVIKVEEFASMSLTERSKLYGTDPKAYEALFKQAVEKNLIK